MSNDERSNFLRTIIEADLAAGTHDGRVATRFPPEPNGYLHIGHAKSICLNFGLARDFGGVCHLRFDDTNPEAEDTEYVESIMQDVQWLGFDWGEHLYFASDYFEKMYGWAVELIEKGLAYVDSQNEEEIRAGRGTVTEAGTASPFRDRSVEDNLDLFARMRAGEFPDGAHVLRAKADMAHANMKMRDPLLYRIRHVHHHRSADAWCIYPMYDYAHCLEDAIEHITHSICTLEFENNRDIYDWAIDNCSVPSRPRQYEFARLNLGYTVMSKRKLRELVEGGHVAGWDDPRMPTITGMRRRGYRPQAIQDFCERIGVAKANSLVDADLLDYSVRADLNFVAPRVMAVQRPLKLVVTNWEDHELDELDASYWPHDVPNEGSRKVPFTRELYIEQDDFQMNPEPGFRRLAPGREVRLRYAYLFTCTEVVEDAGRVIEVRGSVDRDSRGGQSPDGRKVKGTIHWVSASRGLPAEFRLYDRLFAVEKPEDVAGGFLSAIDPESLTVTRGVVEPSVAEDPADTRYQFERLGYFWRDPVDSPPPTLVFNRIVSLRDRTRVAKVEAPVEVARKEPGRKRIKRSGAEIRAEARDADLTLAAAFGDFKSAGMKDKQADVLSGDVSTVHFVRDALGVGAKAGALGKFAANELIGQLSGRSVDEVGLTGAAFGTLVKRVGEGTISSRVAKDLLAEFLEPGLDVDAVIAERGLEQVADPSAILPVIAEVMAANPDKVAAFRAGNERMSGFFIGQVMRASGGTADPGLVRKLVMESLAG